MNFGFTEEQNLLREQVERFMREDCSLAKVRELCNEQKGFDTSPWEKIEERFHVRQDTRTPALWANLRGWTGN